MTEIGGRTVAVDLCLPSGKYKKIVEAEKSKKMEEVQMNSTFLFSINVSQLRLTS